MSKIGKKPIIVPQGVDITVDGGFISIKGPKGILIKPVPQYVEIAVTEGVLTITPRDAGSRNASVFWGLARSLIQNMIIGVTAGFEKVLEFQGIGYKATVKGDDLELGLGFSHPIVVPGTEGISFKTEKTSIRIQGMDKELVGKIAAKIRNYRKPEPYKGSGIRYQGEIIRRKAGKKAATAA